MSGATGKQIRFIETLLATKDHDLYETLEYQTVESGMGGELTVQQASEFIDELLQCGDKAIKPADPIPDVEVTFEVGDQVKTKKGPGVVTKIEGQVVTVRHPWKSYSKVHASTVKED